MEEFERTMPASSHGTLHIYVSTMAALSHKQVKVNTLKMLHNEVICALAMAEQFSQ